MSVGFVFYSKFVLRICLYIVSNKSPVMVNSHLTHLRAEDLVGRNVEIATVDYNVPVAVVRENTQLCTYFFDPYTPTY